MRIERWYWLAAFCWVSFVIHLAVAYRGGSLLATLPLMADKEIVVELEPLPEPKPEPKKPEPKKPEPKQEPKPIIKKELPPAPVQPPSRNDRRIVRLPQPKNENSDLRQKEPPKIDPAEDVARQPNVDPGGTDPTKDEKPLPLGLPSRPRDDSVKLTRRDKTELPKLGGGSVSPSPIPDGKNGLDAPESPPEDIIYTGGGAGGINLPRAAPRIGGGGGKDFIGVVNPLAKEVIPEEKPGAGPGLDGGEGAGAGGGAGFGNRYGVGTKINGKDALATLKAKPGAGLGAGKGDKIGTNPPGGGTGTGSELPGTGGEGTGYGRGKGVGIGDGGGKGVVGLDRGIPFGDITGLLNGDPDGGGGTGGGPGGPGRGAVFGQRPIGGGGGKVHIVYVLDISGSMSRGNKIGKAQEALKQALSELKRTDSFNIVVFAASPEILSATMLPANQENVLRAMNYVDDIRVRDGTNVSSAMEAALSLIGSTHIFLMSDGEPTSGIRDPAQLRAFIKELNTHNVSITTLALVLGENAPGYQFLKSIAEDNKGKFSFVNLLKVANPDN